MTAPLSFSLFDAALRGTLIALFALLAAVLLRDRGGAAQARAGIALCLGLGVQVIAATPALEAGLLMVWQAPLIAVSVANAVLFWIFARALFDDDFRWHAGYALAWCGAVGLSLLNCLSLPAPTPVVDGLTVLQPALGMVQRLVPLVGALLAVAAAASGWRADLVERRRWLRAFILVAGVFYTLAMLAVRLASPQGRLSPLAATLDVGLLLGIVAVVAWHLLRFADTDLFPPAAPSRSSEPAPLAALALASSPSASLPTGLPLHLDAEAAQSSSTRVLPQSLGDPAVRAPAPGLTITPSAPDTEPRAVADEFLAREPAPADPADERLAEDLHRLMADERAYRTEDLTIAGLAYRLRVPEYRLRRVINQRLGHRNFNAYVNGWRLEEACAALADPARRDVPVLTLALTAGFQSIGPFNRAFKVATGLTPTEFRRQKLADC